MSEEKTEFESLPGESEEEEADFPIDFNTFILSLSSSATFHLGLNPHPGKKSCCTNLPMAEQTIDILSLLRYKTRRNLSGDEELLLDRIIDDLTEKYEAIKRRCE